MDGSGPLIGMLKAVDPHLVKVLITLMHESFWINHWDHTIDQPLINNSFINNLIKKHEELGVSKRNVDQFLKSVLENFSASALTQLFEENIPRSHPPQRLIEVLEKQKMTQLVDDIEKKIILGDKY